MTMSRPGDTNRIKEDGFSNSDTEQLFEQEWLPRKRSAFFVTFVAL